ncbi:MAG: NAD(P)-dependent oxidoreductase [Phycisphaerales bacterium]|nr:NAD(P)-dependent oxidoreductase [Phycisphaerales bacterium]
MKVVLTGAAGRLGTVVTRQLLAAGYQVLATDTVEGPHLPIPVKVLNLLDANAVMDLCKDAQALIHLANHPGVRRTLGTLGTLHENMQMNANVFQSAIAGDIRKIIFASTIQVIASEQRYHAVQPDQQPVKVSYLPLDSDSPANPTNTYALSKYLSEQILASFVTRPRIQCISMRFPALPEDTIHYPLMAKLPEHPDQVSRTAIGQAFSYLTRNDATALILATLQADLPIIGCTSP